MFFTSLALFSPNVSELFDEYQRIISPVSSHFLQSPPEEVHLSAEICCVIIKFFRPLHGPFDYNFPFSVTAKPSSLSIFSLLWNPLGSPESSARFGLLTMRSPATLSFLARFSQFNSL